MEHRASESAIEPPQMGMTIKVEAEAASAVYVEREVKVNHLQQEAGLVQSVKSETAMSVKTETAEGGGEDGCEQQCVEATSTLDGARSFYEANSESHRDWLIVKQEFDDIDIEPAVFQHMDIHYALTKKTVDCNNKAIRCSGGEKSVEDKLRDNKATSVNCSRTTIEVDCDEAHVSSDMGQQGVLQKHLPHQHRTARSNGFQCNKIFQKPHLLRVRSKLHQRNSRKAVSPRDSIAGPSNQSGDLTKSVGVHTGKKLYQCETCDAKFASNYYLTRHMRVHTIEKPVRCKICNARFAHNDLTEHMRIHEGPYECETCDAKFVRKYYLTRHMRVHTGEKPYQCETCDAKFASNYYLTTHMRVHTGEKPFHCKICDARFTRNGGLTQHMRVHTGKKPFHCKICDARFAQNGSLTQHIRVHTGENPYQCEMCDAKFANNFYLTQHTRVHTGEKPFHCKICNATFAQNDLTEHMRNHTDEKPYRCEKCDAKFSKNHHLNQHMRVHMGEKLYHCKICDARFAQNGGLTQHMRVHTGEKVYQCERCDERFSIRSDLIRHIRVHSKK